MINANLEQFLDTGWFSEATLYYNGHTYWCEGGFDSTDKKMYFWVYRYKSDLFKTPDGEIYIVKDTLKIMMLLIILLYIRLLVKQKMK